MRILAWVAFFGFLIEGGAVLVSCAISYVNPDAAKNLYNGLNLYALRQFNFWHYNLYISFMVALSLMKARVAILVVKLISKLNLETPFTMQVANKLERISYILFGTWLITILSNAHMAWLMKLTNELYGNYVSGEFIFMAGVVFVFSQIFKRGVEIQSENELTV
jgi:hypothetical protein